MIIAQRGRPLTPKRTEYGKRIRKDYEGGRIKEKRSNIQRYEPRNDGICNTITTVLKDNLVVRKAREMEYLDVETSKQIKQENQIGEFEVEAGTKNIEDYLYTAKDGEQYGIFKLSPRECGRLMGVSDMDIDKMAAVNSNSQLYKQFGNSIVVPVLMAIFSQLNIKDVTPWNEMTDEERREVIRRVCEVKEIENENN